MRKIKAFCSIVLVIASVMAFSLVSVPEVASAQTKEDYEFVEWAEEHIDTLLNDVDKMKSDLKSGDFKSFETDVEIAIELHLRRDDKVTENLKLNFTGLSPEVEKIKQSLEFAIYNIEHASFVALGERVEQYLYESAGERYEVQYDASLSILNDVEFELSSCKADLADWKEKNPRYSLPSFEGVFAIISVLGVAYLVIRRKNE